MGPAPCLCESRPAFATELLGRGIGRSARRTSGSRPGAALAAELIAASVSFLLASQWSIDALLSGAVQGMGAELVFLATRYRRTGVVVALYAKGKARQKG